MKQILKVPGFHVRVPWANLLLNGSKTIETRSYALPEKYVNRWLALIETDPGTKAKVVGLIFFERTFRYESIESWKKDAKKHLVGPYDPAFSFAARKETWAWVVKDYLRFDQKLNPPQKRGIRFASQCSIPVVLVQEDVRFVPLRLLDGKNPLSK